MYFLIKVEKNSEEKVKGRLWLIRKINKKRKEKKSESMNVDSKFSVFSSNWLKKKSIVALKIIIFTLIYNYI